MTDSAKEVEAEVVPKDGVHPVEGASADAATERYGLHRLGAVSQYQAAKMCGVSQNTIKRRREKGDFPGAIETGDGTYEIPVQDLVAAGLLDRKSAPDSAGDAAGDTSGASTPESTGKPVEVPESEVLRRENAELREQLHATQLKLVEASVRADEREKSLESMRLALRAIEGGQRHAADAPVQTSAPSDVGAGERTPIPMPAAPATAPEPPPQPAPAATERPRGWLSRALGRR